MTRYRIGSPWWFSVWVITVVVLAGVAFAPLPDLAVIAVVGIAAVPHLIRVRGRFVELRDGHLIIRRRLRTYAVIAIDAIDDVLITHRHLPRSWVAVTPDYACAVVTLVSTRHGGSIPCWPLYASDPATAIELDRLLCALRDALSAAHLSRRPCHRSSATYARRTSPRRAAIR